MYRNTLFGEVMKGLPRGSFEKIVSSHNADKHSKGFSSWDQLITLIYAQISGCNSLREIEEGFNSQSEHHYHLGCGEIRRSTLADANTNRSCGVFEQVCGELLVQAHRKLKRELKDLLYLIDSTPISLKGLGYDDWTKGSHSHRTQGLKVHMMIESSRDVPVYASITAPNVNDIDIGKEIAINKGATYVFDKGYCDYNWWYKFTKEKAVFVTRFKKNAGIKVVGAHEIPADEQETILEDTRVMFKYKHPGGKRINEHFGSELRRVVVDRPDKGTPIILVTNDFERSATEIGSLYKRRWAIELFFKWIKQNLKIKKFLGRSENAVKTQIYTALITYLLVEIHRSRQGLQKTMKMILVSIRAGLFQRPVVEREMARKRRYRRDELHDAQGCLAL